MISPNWLRPLKKDHLKMSNSSPQSLGILMGSRLKGCGCLVCENEGLLSCHQCWATFGCGTYPILFKRLFQYGGGQRCKRKGRPKAAHGNFSCEFLLKCIELEFIPMNFDYILRCKFRDLVNVMNDICANI